MRRPLFLLLCLGAAGCAAPGPYPSLAVREVERRYAAEQTALPEPEPPMPPADAGLAERVRALVAQAQRGEAAFAAEIGDARARVAAAGAAGGEAWILAQQAISRAEAARTPTTRALGDLDALLLAQAAAGTLSGGDLALIEGAMAEVDALKAQQNDALAALKGALRPL